MINSLTKLSWITLPRDRLLNTIARCMFFKMTVGYKRGECFQDSGPKYL
jgi:hypothetical protein